MNPATHTVYVTDQNSNVVAVLDASTCNATTTKGCSTPPTRSLQTGRSPGLVTVDPATDTLYVANDDFTFSVLNGATCNATVTSGCN